MRVRAAHIALVVLGALAACAAEEDGADPSRGISPTTTASSTSAPPSYGKSDQLHDAPDTTSSSTTGTAALDSGLADTGTYGGTYEDALSIGLAACADGTIAAGTFRRAYDERLCEAWEACDGTECVPGLGSDAGEEDEGGFDAEAACGCLEAEWTCEPSYGSRSAELWVVVPDDRCFDVFED